MAKFAAKDSNKNITLSPHGTGKVVVGTGATDATVQSDGNHNLVLQTGNSTTGSITIIDGADGNIAISPNGTGTVVVNTDLDVDNININGNAITSTNTDGNIDLTPNGTGEVNISKVDIDSGAVDGVTIGTNSVATDIRVDNLKLDGNSITSTNLDGDINLTPAGTGHVVASNNSNASTLKLSGAGGISAETAFLDLVASSASDGNVMARIKGIRGGGTGDTEGDIAFSVKSAANTITERLRIGASGSITTPNSTEFNGSIGDSATVSTTQKQAIVNGGGTTEAKGLVPVGAIFQMAFTPGSTWLTTNRFLICDGSSLNSTTDTQYADLYTAIGTTWGGSSASAFNIPDLKGAYLRGVGVSTVFTQDQTITLAQTIDDAFQGHFHSVLGSGSKEYIYNRGGGAGYYTGLGSSGTRDFDRTSAPVGDPSTDGSNGTPRTQNETRPNSRGVQFIIKY